MKFRKIKPMKDQKLDKLRNPEGLTYAEFLEKHKDTPKLAVLCWRFGMTPEELKEELKTLQEKY